MPFAKKHALVIATFGWLLSACDSEHPYRYMSNESTYEGELSYTASRARLHATGGERASRRIGASVSPFRGCELANAQASCAPATVRSAATRTDDPDFTVYFDLPNNTGAHSLATLHAFACENGDWKDPKERCTTVTGSLDVLALTAPCGEEACGRFDAELTIDPAAGDVDDLSVTGHITLHYQETIREGTQTSSGCNLQGG